MQFRTIASGYCVHCAVVIHARGKDDWEAMEKLMTSNTCPYTSTGRHQLIGKGKLERIVIIDVETSNDS